MKIYTRIGDQGETRLVGGVRVAKDTARLEACGSVDELGAALGVVRAGPLPDGFDPLLERIQNELFEVGAELAAPDPAAQGTRTIGPAHVRALEAAIDRYDEGLAELGGFVLPAGAPAAAGLHVARAVCRRAERRLVTLIGQGREPVSRVLLGYLNRLGDLLFVLARAANAAAGRPGVLWQKP